ncbi:MAG TPA: hypothetical protein VE995_01965 [Gaiellaceae bacterium]|nr:hypothetical protein [Gaiellaceae bacterium]
MRFLAFLLAAASLALPATASAAPRMLVGAAEDSAKAPTLVEAKTEMDLARVAGFDAIRLTAQWSPGLRQPSAGDVTRLQNAVDAARLDGIEVFLSVYPYGSSVTPLTPAARADFASYTAFLATALPTVKRFIVGNEPNLNRFWMPQFDAGGGDAAAPAYEALLAQTYDAIKAAAPAAMVIGGALSPRGGDDPQGVRPTHSPTRFIADLGRAYRQSGRTRPIMDAFSFHPYEDNSSVPPSFVHPRSTTISLADYGKLVGLLGSAFDGTAQAGSTLPIVYDEFGVQSVIPAAKVAAYQGRKPASAKPVDEARQGAYYEQALALAACQPNVIGFLIFHVRDEPSLDRWQSGLFYADGTPKASLQVVQRAIASLRAGTLGSCSAASPTVPAAAIPKRNR